MEEFINKRIQSWLDGNYDEYSKNWIQFNKTENPKELADAFYKNLEFGTGGLRGIMGVGTNRMNKFTVGVATQGFANYLKKVYPKQNIKVAIAFDCRNFSKFFAEVTADVFSANKIHCFIFEDLRPTPELSFAVRHFNCHAGVMITASHNPKEYNGYKAYWNDGGQLVPPHDVNVINYVNKVKTIDQVKWERNNQFVQTIGDDVDLAYLEKIKDLSLDPDMISKRKNFKIVYTPLHGTGITMVPPALTKFGFKHVLMVEEQRKPDGDFPTVNSPNPEEKESMELAIQKAIKTRAQVVLATDPDADRIAVAIKNSKSGYYRLNGNETAVVLTHYILEKLQNYKQLSETDYVVKTIVTTDMLQEVAFDFNITCFEVLTGFKYIADKIFELEKNQKFICGGEESYGFLISDFVRDKDAISACCLISEWAASCYAKESTPYKELLKLYQNYGLYKDSLLSITKKGKEGLEEIKSMMDQYRKNPPMFINNSPVEEMRDYLNEVSINFKTNKSTPIKLPVSDVLQFLTEDETKVTVRPSGTEPKIKFYFAVKTKLLKTRDFDKKNKELELKIQNVIKSLQIN
ncbi:MAG TPA: phospho-sugar mutase [Bacteroidales bacterium]|jgi:phosphoglucomutase|nr:phospho-sugar mutase [Bacteroidales bacterium]HPS71063.1 phospho-sugar mutase [Bacteroidales bacterium]